MQNASIDSAADIQLRDPQRFAYCTEPGRWQENPLKRVVLWKLIQAIYCSESKAETDTISGSGPFPKATWVDLGKALQDGWRRVGWCTEGYAGT